MVNTIGGYSFGLYRDTGIPISGLFIKQVNCLEGQAMQQPKEASLRAYTGVKA